ncbi:MAG: hypothetical protein ACJ78X_18340 [Myxococcales bacterium]
MKTGVLAVLAAVAALGCGGGPRTTVTTRSAPAPKLEVQGSPVAVFDAATGKTTVSLDFLARAADGKPLDTATLKVTRLVDDRLADVESTADVKDTRLATNLTIGMVLDVSYSLMTWTPPAFAPMKQAAADSAKAIRAQFAQWNSGSLAIAAAWFQDQYVCEAATSGVQADTGLLNIPAPQPGDATKLYAATAGAIDRLAQAQAASAGTARDHFALVVFTDGYDNYSWHDDSALAPKQVPVTGGTFDCRGPPATTLQQVLDKLAAFPQLKVYVIGLGNQVNTAELQRLVSTGGGRLVSSADSGDVAALFTDVTREFTTVRRDGIKMPLQPGRYEYTEEVTTVEGGKARIRFGFTAGDPSAAVDLASIRYE